MTIDTVLLDRDGIINEVIIRGKIVSSPRIIDEFSFMEGISDFINKMNTMSINLAIISNQPDISRGLLSNDSLEFMNKLIQTELGVSNIFICTHDDIDACSCRKPKTGLLQRAQKVMGFDKESAIFVGDGWKDMKAGSRFGIKTVLLRTNYNLNANGDIEIDNLTQLENVVFAK